MKSSIREQLDEPVDQEPPRLPVECSWTAHPARQRPRRAAGAAAVIIAIGAIVFIMFRLDSWQPLESLGAGGVSILILVLALHRFFFESRYEIDASGISSSSLLTKSRIEWWRVKRFLHDDHGGYLSSRAVRSRFDAFRGVHLLFNDDAEERARIVEEILNRIRTARDGEPESSSAECAESGEQDESENENGT